MLVGVVVLIVVEEIGLVVDVVLIVVVVLCLGFPAMTVAASANIVKSLKMDRSDNCILAILLRSMRGLLWKI